MSLIDRFRAEGAHRLRAAVADAERLRGRFVALAAAFDRAAGRHQVQLVRQGLRAGAAHARGRVDQLGRLLTGLQRIGAVAFPGALGLAPAVLAAIALGGGLTVYTVADVGRVIVQWRREADAMEAQVRREAQFVAALQSETDPKRREELARAFVGAINKPFEAGTGSGWTIVGAVALAGAVVAALKWWRARHA